MPHTLAFRNHLLDYTVGRQTSFTPANGNTRLRLYTVAPDANGVGGTLVTGGGYQHLDPAGKFNNAAANGSISNSAELAWPTATADWGTVVGIGIWRGNKLLRYIKAAQPVTIDDKDTLKIPKGNLVLGLE